MRGLLEAHWGSSNGPGEGRKVVERPGGGEVGRSRWVGRNSSG